MCCVLDLYLSVHEPKLTQVKDAIMMAADTVHATVNAAKNIKSDVCFFTAVIFNAVL
jgi:hypothetical protein